MACLIELARNGYQVWGALKEPERFRKVHKGPWNNTHLILMNIREKNSIDNAIKKILKETGNVIDVLINTADQKARGSVEEMPALSVASLFETNFFHFIQILKDVIPAMRERREGTIINISPLTHDYCIPYYSQYFAIKTAQEQLISGLRTELKPFHIQVASLLIGWVKETEPGSVIPSVSYPSPYSRHIYQTDIEISASVRKGIEPENAARKVLKMLKQKNLNPRYYLTPFPHSLLLYFTRFLPRNLEEEMMLAYLKLKEKRRFRRVGIHRDVVLSTAGKERFKVKLIDISRGGIKFLYYRDRIRIEQGIRLNNRYFEVMLLSKDLDHRIIRIMFRNVMTRAQFRDLVEQLRKA